jgi:5-methyltetrahydrofolate--homocysteine methyltransferase
MKMNKKEFRQLFDNKIMVLDGATGTNLMAAGMPLGVCPEKYILEHKDVMKNLQKAYLDAGTDILYAPTFTCNRIKLMEYGLEDKLHDMNIELVKLSKEAVAECGHGYVAGDLTMTGEMLYPMGKLQFEELVDVYKEQIKALEEAGCDLLVVETMMSLAETRAAVIAANEVSSLPVMASLTFNEDGKTLYGTDPVTAVNVLQSLGADAIGVNCSTGPDKMVEIVTAMKSIAYVPVFAKPNAGMPEIVDGESVYLMTPEEFAEDISGVIDAGANMVGGCCGTTPAHIKALADMAKTKNIPDISNIHRRSLSSERMTTFIELDGPFMVVGERINPTGKKKLQAELRENRLDLVMTMAEEQVEHGASVLDINVGMNGIDEKEMMVKVVYEVSQAVNLPLCIDSSNPEVIEAALRIYPGRALINSVSLEKVKMEKVLPLAQKYGAMFILLPLSDAGLPANREEKENIINTILATAFDMGFCKEDIVVDGLVATVGADKAAAVNCLRTISYCHDMGLATICGLSNISFGLPERMFVNTAFLTMAISRGLTMAIANPSQTMLMNAAFASDMLLNKEDSDIRYIENVKALNIGGAPAENKAGSSSTEQQNKEAGEESVIFTDVVKGNKRNIIDDVNNALENGAEPQTIIDNDLIPAINKVGELFEKKKYFLPQLISSAEAMEMAISVITPLIVRDENAEALPTIVIATVEGDIHDIGKNLVVLMLRNYGFNVIDLGKDVPAEVIVDEAVKNNAAIIGLSALMTTTMMKMVDVVELVKERQLSIKVIIGGAVITESFAEEIGADGYSKDAAEAVVLVKRLLNLQ